MTAPRYLNLYKVGHIVRYGYRETAIMCIEQVRAPYGGAIARYWGEDCMGGTVGAYHHEIRPANLDDAVVWEQGRAHRQRKSSQEKGKHHDHRNEKT